MPASRTVSNPPLFFLFLLSRFNFPESNPPGWLKVSQPTRYVLGLSPIQNPPSRTEGAAQPLLTLRPVLCKAESSERLLLLPPPLEVGVGQEAAEGLPTKAVVVVAAAATTTTAGSVRPGATAPSTGDPRELAGSAGQIYSEHSYCRLPT